MSPGSKKMALFDGGNTEHALCATLGRWVETMGDRWSHKEADLTPCRSLQEIIAPIKIKEVLVLKGRRFGVQRKVSERPFMFINVMSA